MYERAQDVVFSLVHKVENYLSQKDNDFTIH
jgi:hypothetical protein